MDTKKLIRISDQFASEMCAAAANEGMSPDETMQAATIMFCLIKRCHPDPDKLMTLMMTAEAQLQAVLGEATGE